MAGYMSSSRNEPVESGSSTSRKHLLVEDADRLSTLPQEILSQILSLLPTIDAAKVGLLSKICRNAWCSLSNLSFDYSQFPETENKSYAFINFIDHTLSYHDESDVKTLEVRHWPFIDCEIPIKSLWTTFAILHKVERLVLYGYMDDVKLPDCLYPCHTLVKLELAIPDLVLPSKILALPNLRKLKLKFLVLAELAVGEDLFSSLPSLEKLSIFFCYLGHSIDISVSSMKLEELIICSCQGMESCSLKLLAPCLSNFIYISDVLGKGDLDVFPSGSQFVINGGAAFVVTESVHKLTLSLIKVTEELFKSTSLSLSHWLIEYLSLANDLPGQLNSDIFNNILKLDVCVWPITDHIQVLILLASRCPNLNELSLVLVTPQRRALQLLSEDSPIDCHTAGGFCKVNNVRIENFGGGRVEMMLVRFLLGNMIELCLMRIVMNGFMVRNDMHLKISEILGYEKASAFADVIFD